MFLVVNGAFWGALFQFLGWCVTDLRFQRCFTGCVCGLVGFLDVYLRDSGCCFD